MQDLELKQLGGFTGTQSYANLFGVKATDGVQYIMENGYSWFVTDAVIATRMVGNLKDEPFLTIELKLLAGSKAQTVITDGNEKVLYSQDYGYTDAKKGVKLFLTDGVVLLPSEY